MLLECRWRAWTLPEIAVGWLCCGLPAPGRCSLPGALLVLGELRVTAVWTGHRLPPWENGQALPSLVLIQAFGVCVVGWCYPGAPACGGMGLHLERNEHVLTGHSLSSSCIASLLPVVTVFMAQHLSPCHSLHSRPSPGSVPDLALALGEGHLLPLRRLAPSHASALTSQQKTALHLSRLLHQP